MRSVGCFRVVLAIRTGDDQLFSPVSPALKDDEDVYRVCGLAHECSYLSSAVIAPRVRNLRKRASLGSLV